MGGSKSRKQAKSQGEDWVAEAEAKGPKDKEDVCLGGHRLRTLITELSFPGQLARARGIVVQ